MRDSTADIIRNFMRNAWEPIAVPRWALTIKYALFVACGLSSFVSTIQTLSLSTPDGYVPIWAACMSVGGILGMVGSFRPKWGALEAVGASIVAAFLVVLTFLVFARGSIPVGLLLIIVLVLPAVRAMFLIARVVLANVHREEWRL